MSWGTLFQPSCKQVDEDVADRGATMTVFFSSKAGRQFVVLCSVAICIWFAGLFWHREIFQVIFLLPTRTAHAILLTQFVAGAASFVYSLLRIFEMRREMLLQEEQARRARWIATHDHLTQLPNRYALDEFDLSAPIETDDAELAQVATVFSIDLNGFKKVNDLVGHQGGDLLLCTVAKRLAAFAARSCVFRLGGDEFLVVARGLIEAREEKFATLMIQSLSQPIEIGSIWCQVGASVGYARWPQDGATLHDVCHRSDIALYQAKGKGGNLSLKFHDDMQQDVKKRAELEGKLRAAIEMDHIRPHYQPLIDLKTGAVCGFEALARWTCEDGSIVPPNVFIAIAEETGMITPLFEKLLSRACSEARQWPEDVSLAFNLSAVQMEDRMLASRILKVLDEAGLARNRLEVEITENALIQDPDLAEMVINDLHDAGVQIALDDFGTGYSSLAQLSRYRFDKLKIDRSFVKSESEHDSKHEKIIQAILNLSRGLNIKTTVEGIEENRQLAYFLGEGCDVGQGYLFGKAVPIEATLSFLQKRNMLLKSA